MHISPSLYMELSEFNNDFFTYLCEKLLREKNKDIVTSMWTY